MSPTKKETNMNETTSTNGKITNMAQIVERVTNREAVHTLISADGQDFGDSADPAPLRDGDAPQSEAVRAPASVADVTTTVVPMSAVVSSLDAAFPGRTDAIKAIALAMLAGEHALLVGPPGTAKSALTRAFAGSVKRRVWEHLMTRFTTPDEVLGPVKLTALQADRFERAIDGYLCTAEVAFLDEVFKANSAILNALLGALNERVITEGASKIKLPLHTCIGASNEVPDPDDGLDAIYDRFLVRTRVEYLTDESAFATMLASGGEVSSVPHADLAAEHAQVRKVKVGQDTVQALVALRKALIAEQITMSDRRWKQSIRILRASAHLDGRTTVDPELDLASLLYVIPGKPEHVAIVERTIAKSTNPIGAKCVERVQAAKEAMKKLPRLDGLDAGQALTTIGGSVREVTAILADLSTLPAGKARDKSEKEIQTILGKLKTMASEVASKAAGL
jgi:MoxR-like ATPase